MRCSRLLRAVCGTGLLAAALTAVPTTARAQSRQPACAPDNAGLILPEGFCALVVADDVGLARHIAVAPNGDVFVALDRSRRGGPGQADFAILRDTDGDGTADIVRRFGAAGGTGIRLHGGYVYFGANNAILRYPWPEGALDPAGPPDTLVSGLPDCCGHAAKGFAIGDGFVYVNVGSASNACQAGRGRQPGIEGLDPCPQLETRAGVWRFPLEPTGQRQPDGVHYTTGLRNTFALDIHPRTGILYGVQHGRDQLAQLWPDLFDERQSAEKPAEEMVRITEGANFGWPYCFYEPELDRKVLAPEYGGDGTIQGRCEDMNGPAMTFPAHWAPNALLFYTGDQFPAAYRGGAFIAFHGSWNRAPMPQAGYNVVFVPFADAEPAGTYRVFADGFAGESVSPRGAAHRPAGLAQGPDGSLYVSDDRGGRIYRILYQGDQD